MKKISVLFALFSTVLCLTACGGSGGGGTPATTSTYKLSGQIQKGPFAIGSQISVNELDESLNPTGRVYNVQTSDDLGHFAVASDIGTHLVEIVGDGFYMDELTGQLAASRIQLRAIVDLSVDSTPTVNVLTSLQAQRLKKLISQGSTYTAAETQSRNEILTVFGIDPTKIISLSRLYSMQINGNTDADSVLLAASAIVSKMATNAAVVNATTQPAELSNYISTIAAQIANTGTITNSAIITAKNLAATQIDLAAVRTNLETYYINRGETTFVAPKFEEWVDKDGSGILPRRLIPATGLIFTDVTGVEPQQQITSNTITVSGLGTGVAAPVTVSAGTTIIKNSTAISGTITTAIDGNTIALRVTSPGYGLTNSWTISVGSSSALWQVTTKLLGGTISGLTGAGLVLQNNGGDNITIPAGSTSFTFPAPVANGVSYNLSVLTPPTTPLQVCTVANGTGTVGAGVSSISVVCSDAEVVYVTNTYSNNISAYLVNTTTGALTSIGTIATGTNPYSIVFDRTGKFAYVANASSNNISAYSITATGALTSIGTTGVGTNTGHVSMAIDPIGNFAYAAGTNASVYIDAYSIDTTTGALTSIGAYATGDGAGSSATSLAIDPTGKFAYVASQLSNKISAYSINTTTGALTSIGTIAAGTQPTSIAIDRTGKFAYVANGFSKNISAYRINTTTGALTSIGTIATGTSPGSIVFDPTGKSVYVLHLETGTIAGYIDAYSIDTTTGALTSIGTIVGAFAAGTQPSSIVFDSTGKFAYVTTSHNIFNAGSIDAYSIDTTTGAFTNIGTIGTGAGPVSTVITRVP